MAERRPTVLPQEHVDRHPAFLAWRELRPNARPPAAIEILQRAKRDSAAVYRLIGAGPAGAAVIAKGRREGELEIPRRLYAEVLPDIAAPTLACHGFVERYDGHSWLFLEDAGDDRYSPKVAAHRALAADWLAALHTAALPPAPWLRRVDFRPALLQTTRDELRACRGHPALTAANVDTLERIQRWLDRAEGRWNELAAVAADVPESLVHGDFVPKNIRVRRRPRGLELVALDWDAAGRANPAYELGLLPRERASLRAYHLRVRAAGWRPGWPELVRLKDLSDLYWAVTFVQWETRSFRYEWIESAMRRMEVYERWLRAGAETVARPGAAV